MKNIMNIPVSGPMPAKFLLWSLPGASPGPSGRARGTPQKAVFDQLFASWPPRRAPSELIFGPEGGQEGQKADPAMKYAATRSARAVPVASEAPSEASTG